MAAQALRPDTWCRESNEKLGRAAAAALAAEAAAEAAGEGQGVGSNDKRVGGAGRVGSDGLRRCGKPRPDMFKPTTLAKRGDDTIDRRRTGEVRGSERLNMKKKLRRSFLFELELRE